MKKRCYILAGPNGSGKTTFAYEFLPVEAECLNFVNADLIAQGLSPFEPEKMAIAAGDLAIERVRLRVAQGGHNVPENIVRRRFDRSWKNFQEIYKSFADSWTVFDTSGKRPVIVEDSGGD